MSHYGQTCSWGIAGKQFVRAIHRTGFGLILKPIYASNRLDINIPQDIKEIEKNVIPTEDGIQVIIQHTLPTSFHRFNAYNIGITFTETWDMGHSPWIQNINDSLDELWVVSKSERDALIGSGVKIPIYHIGYPYEKDFDDQEIEYDNPNKTFRFYFVGEARDRKNLYGALLAYNREFKKDEKVELIIKSDFLRQEELQAFIRRTRLYDNHEDYPSQTFITSKLDRDEILSIHKSSHCLLVPSRGESICLPIYDALYFGNEVLCTDHIHTKSIFQNRLQYINSYRVPVQYNEAPVPQVYRAWETWYEPDILHLQQLMRSSMSLSELSRNKNNTFPKPNFRVKETMEEICINKVVENISNRLTEIKKYL